MDVEQSVRVVLPYFTGVEDRYLEGWDRFAFAVTVAAQGAGNFAGVRFRNPAASGVVAVFEQIKFVSTGSLKDTYAVQYIRPPAADLTLIGLTGNQIDSRGRTAATLIASSGTAPGAGATFFFGSVAADGVDNVFQFDTMQAILLPNEMLQVKSGTINQAMVAAFVWRERSLEASELT